MYGVIASRITSQGEPLLLTLAEQHGSGWLIRARRPETRLTNFQRWKRVLGHGPYLYRDGLFRFGYAYINEATGQPLVMQSSGLDPFPEGGVVLAVPTLGSETGRIGWDALWGLRMPSEDTKVATLIAAQSSDSITVVLDVPEGAEDAAVITFRDHGGDNQKWVFRVDE